ncbi:carbohydrate ABC transporter permease [Ruania halotolerans]|uniref:carbohydrate ABC transporter permease n=1 Tax=Ruania halotolerans TaxID=2897773 RepID=UPI001E4AA7E6|nr:sugar ABC transporter permease [Ruania halotolerans]UFU06766.1 sugar ABC transporter permease [Ruania halotolerans]
MAPQDVMSHRSAPQPAAYHSRERRRGRRRRNRREYALFALLLLPNITLVATFEYWPVLYNAYLSLTDWNMISGAPEWVGLDNYVDLFTSSAFHQVLSNTAYFAVFVIIGSVVLGLLLALLLNQKLRLRGVVRTAAFAPYVISGAAVATLWLFIFDPNYGLSRFVFSGLGATSPRWVTDAEWAMPALIIAYLWKGVGFVAIVYLAGLQGLPEEYDEAARIDGAGRWTIFRRITLPLLSPVTFFVSVITTIGTFQAYDLIAVLTGGGPGISTTTLSWYVYERAFKASDAGGAAASAMILFAILLVITVVQNMYSQRKVHYQ